MRLGGPVFTAYETPDVWIRSLQSLGYRAAYCPVDIDASTESIQAYEKAAEQADVIIAEVGAWCNPISDDRSTRESALVKCKASLYLADKIGARCCVNIAGSKGLVWDGPHADNLTSNTFDTIVESVRGIIDDVAPSRAFYTLETMPWIFPDTVESYVALIKAIDRKRFAVHCDPVNFINSPSRYYENRTVITDFFRALGPYIKSCHAKDIFLQNSLTVHLDEVRPGAGSLDYGVYLRELNRLHHDVPIMLEHLRDESEYSLAAKHIRGVAIKDHLKL